jgi:hypothetical protein
VQSTIQTFGDDHAVKDLMSGETNMTRMMAILQKLGNPQGSSDGPVAVFYDNITDTVVQQNMTTGVKTRFTAPTSSSKDAQPKKK